MHCDVITAVASLCRYSATYQFGNPLDWGLKKFTVHQENWALCRAVWGLGQIESDSLLKPSVGSEEQLSFVPFCSLPNYLIVL